MGAMLRWTCRTHAGLFWIEPAPRKGWRLGIDDEPLGWYETPDQAAGDVYLQSTGCFEWDDGPTPDSPADLGDWQKDGE